MPISIIFDRYSNVELQAVLLIQKKNLFYRRKVRLRIVDNIDTIRRVTKNTSHVLYKKCYIGKVKVPKICLISKTHKKAGSNKLVTIK